MTNKLKTTPYSRYVDAYCDHLSDNNAKKPIFGMQVALIDELECYIKNGNPPEKEMMFALLNALRMTVYGEKPYLFQVAKNGPPVSLAAEYCIQDAVRYCRQARDSGTSYDKAPITTVATEYGVEPNTVRRWVKKYDGTELPISNDLQNPESMMKIMNIAASVYKKYSKKRGPSAHKY